ncbi:amidohydrolase family protein [Caulobacter sp. 73W]|uniref:Amidohydrolase family protein n=1 Tax=Caulobacter sp. 73W TaxID=3161137 RepID=A0AB39KSG9_9CAUL
MNKRLVCSAAAMALLLNVDMAAAQAVTVLDAERLFDGSAVIDKARVVIKDGKVVASGPQAEVAAPAGAKRVDLGDRFVMPGLVTAHSHVGMVQGLDVGGHNYSRETVGRDLAQFQRYGVVAVNALGMNAELFHTLRREWRGGAHGGADLYGAGGGVGAVDGAPPARMKPPASVMRPTTPEAARKAVDAMADAGVDMIKVWVDDLNGQSPKMTPEVYAAAIDQAHRRGLKAAVHIHALADAKGVVRAGADVIGHGVRDMPVDEEFTTLLRERGVWYIPTVNINEAEYIYAEHPEWLKDPFFRMAVTPALEAQLNDAQWRQAALDKAQPSRAAVSMNIANLRRVHAGGGKIAFGTDSGVTPLRIPGFAEHLELGHFVQAGLTPVEALTAATASSAALMGLKDRGCLAAGCRADLLVLRADPTADIANSRTIEAVWRNGAPIAQ